MEFGKIKNYNSPIKCDQCGGSNIKYKGIGEYQCESCDAIMYDDYGKVRNFIEENPGATVAETSAATGVPKSRIRQLLVDDRIQIAPESAVFLRCESCGIEIRSGKYCTKCAQKMAADERKIKTSHISGGFGKKVNDATGVRRFER